MNIIDVSIHLERYERLTTLVTMAAALLDTVLSMRDDIAMSTWSREVLILAYNTNTTIPQLYRDTPL